MRGGGGGMMDDDERVGHAQIPNSFGHELRACLRCRLVKTYDQFRENGCENCPFLDMDKDRDNVVSCTTANFTGIISLMDPNRSWAASWLRIGTLGPFLPVLFSRTRHSQIVIASPSRLLTPGTCRIPIRVPLPPRRMASDDSSSSRSTEKKEEAAAGGAGFDDLEDPRFQCCVCLELLYKPVVIACGHMSCFWCVHKAMHFARESHCAICRQPYTHFPSICQLLHHLLLKLEPAEYKKREKEVLEQERSVDTFSPQIIEFLNSKNNNGENGKDWGNKLEDGKTGPPGEVSVDENTINEHSMKIKLDDVSCPICKELLYQPAVLNCGHVYCISCLPSVADEALKCQVCGGLHPGDFPNVCLDLDHFLEEYFPAEYESRRNKLQLENSQCNPEGSSSSTSCKKGTFVQKTLDLSNVHIGVGCDSCGVYPIRGQRYKCMDCTEAIGFDLCGECYNSTSKLPGRFNQQHTPDHRMELDNTSLFDAFLRFQGIPAEGLQQLVQQMELIGADGMVQIVADDDQMEDDHEDA